MSRGLGRIRLRSVSRGVFCGRCNTDLGFVFERDTEGGTSADFLPHSDCPHVSREKIVDDVGALYLGESSLPVVLKPLAVRVNALHPGG